MQTILTLLSPIKYLKYKKNKNTINLIPPLNPNTILKLNKLSEIKTLSPIFYFGKIFGNAFHSYQYESDAKKLLLSCISHFNNNSFALVKCIIPLDSNFIYYGLESNIYPSYTSNKIIPVEIISNI